MELDMDSSDFFNHNLTIGFIGFGLIAGSIAKALKNVHPEYQIIATSRTLAPLNEALSDGAIDKIIPTLDHHFSQCDYIFLCTPVVTITSYFSKLKTIVKKNCIITDVGSVKTIIHEAAANCGLQQHFIGGHPMAGSEKSGYQYANASILKGATYVITPFDNTDKNKLTAYKMLVEQMQCNAIIMDYKQHDYCVASVSHLPHLISAALSKMVYENDDAENHMHMLAAGGFKDTTRIAASSPEMWEQICASNGTAISMLLKKYIHLLQEIEEHIHTDNSNNNEYIRQLFQIARDYRNTF